MVVLDAYSMCDINSAHMYVFVWNVSQHVIWYIAFFNIHYYPFFTLFLNNCHTLFNLCINVICVNFAMVIIMNFYPNSLSWTWCKALANEKNPHSGSSFCLYCILIHIWPLPSVFSNSALWSQIFFKFSALSLKSHRFFSNTRSFFSHSR